MGGAHLQVADLLPDEEVPDRLGRFALLEELGRGGMSVVLRAHDEELGREVALKLLDTGAWTSRDVERFRREGRALARLEHPGVVQLHDVGALEGRPYLVMELVEGCTLADALAEGIVSRDEALRAAAEVAETLAYVHAQGLVHRDVKPSNVLLSAASGRARLSDFGLALDSGEQRLTRTDGFVGTPAYLPPEQADGAASPAADVYSLGATLYESICGRPPFEAESMMDLLKRLAVEEPEPLERCDPEIDPRLAALVAECLRKEPAARPPAEQVAARLEAILSGPPPARGPRAAAGVLAALALLGAAGVGWASLPGATPRAAEARGVRGPRPPDMALVGWGPARASLDGVRITRRRGLRAERRKFLAFVEPGRSELAGEFVLPGEPPWATFTVTGRCLRVSGAHRAWLEVELNGLPLPQRVLTDGSDSRIDLPAGLLRAGRNEVTLRLPAGTAGRVLLETVELCFGWGARPRPSRHEVWAAIHEPRGVQLVAREAIDEDGQRGLLLDSPGESRLEFELCCDYDPRWAVIHAGVEVDSHRGVFLALRVNGHAVYEHWEGDGIRLPGAFLREGVNRLSVTRGPGHEAVSVRLIDLRVDYGEELLSSEEELLVIHHQPGEAD